MAPSRRTRRNLILLAVLALLALIYIMTGASSTESSPFYQKTMKLMENRKTSAGKSQPLAGAAKAGVGVTGGAEALTDAASGTLKERLKQAETEAKRNAARKGGSNRGAAPQPAQPQQPMAGQKKPALAADDGEDEERARQRKALRDKAVAEFARLLTVAPVLIFSKSYCPYSLKAKHILLENHNISPAPHVVELDLMDQKHRGSGRALQELLRERTGRGTVPNVLVGGESIGGGDDMEAMWREGRVAEVMEKAGGREVKSVEVVNKWQPPAQQQQQ